MKIWNLFAYIFPPKGQAVVGEHWRGAILGDRSDEKKEKESFRFLRIFNNITRKGTLDLPLTMRVLGARAMSACVVT